MRQTSARSYEELHATMLRGEWLAGMIMLTFQALIVAGLTLGSF
jgi:hypothetical protein